MNKEKIPRNITLPQDNSFIELLRFYCQTSEYDDPTLPFMASMWSYVLSDGVLNGLHLRSACLYLNKRMKDLGLEEVEFNESK